MCMAIQPLNNDPGYDIFVCYIDIYREIEMNNTWLILLQDDGVS